MDRFPVGRAATGRSAVRHDSRYRRRRPHVAAVAGRDGYEPATLDVELRGVAMSEVSVGLVVLPVKLRAVQVQGVSGAVITPFSSTADGDGQARVAAARQRQRAFLGSDVRELTNADVVEAATLGDGDLFRALRRLPGVTGYDDWSTELWIRGGTWYQTQVLFDGLPLIQPMHAEGTLAGVGTEAIGAAFLHPGVRPASLAGDGASLVDLRSRPGGGDGRVRTTAELTRVGGSLAFDQRSRDGHYDWSVSARRSLEDLLPRGADWLAGGLIHDRASHYSEISMRGDASRRGGAVLETSALFTNDYGPDLRTQTTQGGGNDVVKVAVRAPIGAFVTTHSVGMSHYASGVQKFSIAEVTGDTARATRTVTSFSAPEAERMDYVTLGGELRPRTADQFVPWSLRYAWTTRRYSIFEIPIPGDPNPLSDSVSHEHGALTYATVFGERR